MKGYMWPENKYYIHKVKSIKH